jgi:hypothetical protein
MCIPPKHRVPQVRDSLIVANVGGVTFIEAAAHLPPAAASKVEVDS